MTSDANRGRVPGTALAPTDADLAELAWLCMRFRRHHIFRDVASGRGVRYIAHGAAIGVRPHTIITGDLAELRDELEKQLHTGKP